MKGNYIALYGNAELLHAIAWRLKDRFTHISHEEGQLYFNYPFQLNKPIEAFAADADSICIRLRK